MLLCKNRGNHKNQREDPSCHHKIDLNQIPVLLSPSGERNQCRGLWRGSQMCRHPACRSLPACRLCNCQEAHKTGCSWPTFWVWGSVGLARRGPCSDLSLSWLTLALRATATLSPQAAPQITCLQKSSISTRGQTCGSTA